MSTRSLRADLFQDWAVNPANPRSRLVLVFFRLAHRCSTRPSRDPLRLVVGVAYRVVVTWILGIELPWHTQVGPRLRLFHGVGLVVNDHTVIGADVVLRHGVTLGHKVPGGPAPVIGDRVEFGASSIVLGDVHIGDDAAVGAGAVVLRDVAAGTAVAGNPARPIARREPS